MRSSAQHHCSVREAVCSQSHCARFALTCHLVRASSSVIGGSNAALETRLKCDFSNRSYFLIVRCGGEYALLQPGLGAANWRNCAGERELVSWRSERTGSSALGKAR
jgi:hypothetical protein